MNLPSLCSILLSASFLLAGAVAASAQMHESYSDVLLLVNERSWASKEIGGYFASRRGIPERHIYRFQADTSETMDSTTFTALRWNLQEWMRANDLVDSINYIVTTKGCPLRVTTTVNDSLTQTYQRFGGRSSFEDCLTLINGADSSLILRTREQLYVSRFYNSQERFRRSRDLPMYLVTRLDAYQVDQVKSMILRAETPAILGDGEWTMDIAPERDNPQYRQGNDWMRDANDILRALGLNVFFDTTTTYVHNRQGVLGYFSWGSNDGNSGGGAAAKPGNTWLNGSIAETIVSTGGRSFMPGTGYGQSLVADWLAEGVNAVKGYTDEPFLVSIAHADILFARYAAGWNMAESYAAASQLIAWRQVTVGDPKMRLRLAVEAVDSSLDFGMVARFTPAIDTVAFVAATDGVTVVSAGIGSEGTQDNLNFVVTPVDDTLPLLLDSGQTVRFAVGFAATEYRPFAAQLNVAYRRSGLPNATFAARLPLSGSGVLPTLALPDTLDFGAPSGNDPVHLPLLLINTSAADTLSLNSLSIGGTDRARFKLDSGTKTLQQIAPGDTATIGVLYRPSGVASHTATLTVFATAQEMPHTIQLVGRSNTSGVASVSDEQIVVWPQPARGSLGVRLPLESGTVERAEVVAVTGGSTAVAVQSGAAGEARLDISSVAPGHYLLRLVSSRGVVIERTITVVGK